MRLIDLPQTDLEKAIAKKSMQSRQLWSFRLDEPEDDDFLTPVFWADACKELYRLAQEQPVPPAYISGAYSTRLEPIVHDQSDILQLLEE